MHVRVVRLVFLLGGREFVDASDSGFAPEGVKGISSPGFPVDLSVDEEDFHAYVCFGAKIPAFSHRAPSELGADITLPAGAAAFLVVRLGWLDLGGWLAPEAALAQWVAAGASAGGLPVPIVVECADYDAHGRPPCPVWGFSYSPKVASQKGTCLVSVTVLCFSTCTGTSRYLVASLVPVSTSSQT